MGVPDRLGGKIQNPVCTTGCYSIISKRLFLNVILDSDFPWTGHSLIITLPFHASRIISLNIYDFRISFTMNKTGKQKFH